MFRTLDMILIAIMLSAAAWTFGVKHDAEAIEETLRAVDRQIALERDTISLLEADWSLLNQPYRLQKLADTFSTELALAPLRPDQIVSPDELPAEPVRLIPEPDAQQGGYAAATRSALR